jgi:hypothetical protein
MTCSIKMCPEKKNEKELCYKCEKYPCKRIKNLQKRYVTKYGEDLFRNFEQIKENGIRKFIEMQNEEWQCPECGNLLCVHKDTCNYCGKTNKKYPDRLLKNSTEGVFQEPAKRIK